MTTLTEPTVTTNDETRRPRFISRYSPQYTSWAVYEYKDASFTWVQRGATQATAEALALFLNATVPDTMHQWAVRRMLAPISDLNIRN